MSPEVLKAKVSLVGEALVGKTSLVRRFVLDTYDDRYLATLGAKVTKKEVPVHTGGRDVRVVLTIWDVMGEPSFRDLLREAYFGGAQGVLGVADLTRPATVRALPAWIDGARSVAGPVPVVLAGNKADLAAAPEADGALEDFATRLRFPLFRASAKTGTRVGPAFQALAEAIARRSAGREEGAAPRAVQGAQP